MKTKPFTEHDFHRLWTDCVGRPRYEKPRWRDLHVRFMDAASKYDDPALQQIIEEAKRLHEQQTATGPSVSVGKPLL